jgi:hypothetical protein
MKKNRKHPTHKPTEQYVVGRREDDFCWLLPEVEGDSADDRNLDAARRFSSLTEAIASSTTCGANVLEVIADGKGGKELFELLVDLDKINTVPFPSCYWLIDGLAVGPNPICRYVADTEQRVKRLRRAGVCTIVSLLDRAELLWSNEERNEMGLETFRHHIFPIGHGEVPNPGTMTLILDVIDESIASDQTTFVHCFSGRGRSGLVAACFAARHGVASGESLLNFLAKRRLEYGLFEPSPENEEHRQFARIWRLGQ